jgi:hypothetical protein
MTVHGMLTGVDTTPNANCEVDPRARVVLPISSDRPLLIRALATFGVDAGIIDAPGHVVATIVRDASGKITGLELEPI